MEEIDQAIINFNKSGVTLINITLTFIMFGVALDLTIENFKSLLSEPKKILTGMFSQLILLPLLTFLLIIIFKPIPSVALGMILVASCPGGNISNFISSIAKGNVELSIMLTIVSSSIAILFTPFNLSFYGNMYEPTQQIMREVNLNWLEVTWTIASIIIIPVFCGMVFKNKFPALAAKLSKPMRIISMALFLLIVAGALASNYHHFMELVGVVFILVFLHNALALSSGYLCGKVMGFPDRDRRSLAIETGIQNSGLGLLLIFSYFDGLGGMAIVTAWWGVWHIVSGFTIAYLWNKR